MTVINTNVNGLIGLNNLRQTNLGLQTSLQRLSSGLRINQASDDPSGLAIAKGMEAQIGGMRAAMVNAEDGINMIHTADGALSESQDILLRMRDLTIRASNEATLTTSDRTKLDDEFQSLKNELDRKAQSLTFNKKNLFNGTLQTAGQHMLQIGADNGTNYQISIVVSNLQITSKVLNSGFISAGANAAAAAAFVSVATVASAVDRKFISFNSAYVGGNSGLMLMSTDLTTVTHAQQAIDEIENALETVNASRSYLGVQERRILHIIDDLAAQDINISAAKSRIYDADMAVEIAEFTRLQILQQSGTAILAQANAQPQSVLQLLK